MVPKRQDAARMQLAERLSHINLFGGMPLKQIEELLLRIDYEVRHFDKGEIIFHETTPFNWVMPILSGLVNMYEPGANGNRHLIRTVSTGFSFGVTLVTGRLEYYPGMAVAASPCELVFLEVAKIRDIWFDMRFRKWFENFYSIASEYVHYCWRKLSIMSCKTTEDKFFLYLSWQASEVGSNDVRLPFVRMEDCATFLGVTRTSLSLAIKRLVKRGEIIYLEHGHFILKRLGHSL